jgi:DNA-binding response OmpR family regulator
MRQELIDASQNCENPEAFIAGAEWMERFLNPLPDEDIYLSSDDYSVSFQDKKIFLPKKEFELSRYLKKNYGRVISRDELLEKVWFNEYIGERTVDVHIRKIKSKISIVPIRTIKGVGYIWQKI